MSNRKESDQERLLKIYVQNLALYEQQAAVMGGEVHASPDLHHKLHDTRAKISKLRADIKAGRLTYDGVPSKKKVVKPTTPVQPVEPPIDPPVSLDPPPLPPEPLPVLDTKPTLSEQLDLLWQVWILGSAAGTVLLALSICLTILFDHFTRDTLAGIVVMVLSFYIFITASDKTQESIWVLGTIQVVVAACALLLITFVPADPANTSLGKIGYIVVVGSGLSGIHRLLWGNKEN